MKRQIGVCAVLGVLTASCAAVDQFSSRAYDGNVNFGSATNKEILLNIIRASHYQSLLWTPTNQISGYQIETLTTGLPTISLGPHQPVADQIYQTTNSVQNQAQGSYQIQPLSTTAFQTGMLAPVDLKTLAWLMTLYPRDFVFFALVQAIDIRLVATNQHARFVNDPAQNYLPKSPEETPDLTLTSNIMSEVCRNYVEGLHKRPIKALTEGNTCSYAKFANLMSALITQGFTVALSEEAPTPALSSGSGGSGQASANASANNATGKFCFDPALANTPVQDYVSRHFGSHLCDASPPAGTPGSGATTVVTVEKTEGSTKTTNSTTTTKPTPTNKKTISYHFDGVGDAVLTIEVRSPSEFFTALGLWEKYGNYLLFSGYTTNPGKRIYSDQQKYVDIEEDGSERDCYAAVTYSGHFYCVPSQATNTSALMDTALILRNLAITPADLNAPVAVRVTQ